MQNQSATKVWLIIESRSHNLKKDLCYIVPLHCSYIINTQPLAGTLQRTRQNIVALLRHSILRFNLKNELILILTLTSNAYSAVQCGKSREEATRWSLMIVYAVGRLLRKSTQSMFVGLPLTTKSQKFTAAKEDRSMWKLQCFSAIHETCLSRSASIVGSFMSIGLVSNISLRWLVQKWLMTDTSNTSQ